MKNHLLCLFLSLALLSSCNTSKEIIYFQDVEVNSPEAVAPPQGSDIHRSVEQGP